MPSILYSTERLTCLKDHSGWSLGLKSNKCITFLESMDRMQKCYARPKGSSSHTHALKYIYPCTWVNPSIHCSNVRSATCWSGSRMVDVVTRCFSRRFISGIGNLSYTLSLSAMRMSLEQIMESYDILQRLHALMYIHYCLAKNKNTWHVKQIYSWSWFEWTQANLKHLGT